MGILSPDHQESDFIPYIKNEYVVDVSIPHGNLYLGTLDEYDDATIGPHIAEEIGNMWMRNDEHMKEQVEIVANTMLGKYFARKHSNGLCKKFSFKWTKMIHGFICQVYDDLRNLHMKIVITQKRYGFLQKTRIVLSSMTQFIRRNILQ